VVIVTPTPPPTPPTPPVLSELTQRVLTETAATRKPRGWPPPEDLDPDALLDTPGARRPPLRPAPAVVGVIECGLSDVYYGTVPEGASIRVRLPDDFGAYGPNWTAIAAMTCGASRIEIVGTDARAVTEAVLVLRRRHAEWAEGQR